MRRSFALLLLAFGLALGSSNASQQEQQQKPEQQKKSDAKPENTDETIRFDTDLVVLNLTITDANDRYVTGLKMEDFKVFEDKWQQKILSFSYDEKPFSVAILLDASLSMEQKLTMARAACARFVEGLRVGDTFAIYSFSGFKVKTLQEFTDVRDIPDAVWDMKAEGETPLYDAIVKAADALAQREERRRAILVVSDGADTKSKASLDQAMRKVSDAQISVYAVDLSDAAVFRTQRRDNGSEIMKQMAAKSGGKFFSAAGGGKLREAFENTIEELRQQYTLTYESSNDRYDGRWRNVEVQTTKPQLNIRTRQGYYARKAKH